jgi:catalase
MSQLKTWSTFSHRQGRSATNQEGIPMPSLTASQAIGLNGHVLLQDAFLLEKTASFNRERIPERVVHAKGAGAYGTFQVTNDISRYTKAKFLNTIGKETDVVVRFSTVGGELGSGDTWTDPKGFATKFYTEEGIHDLVGNNIEVFPIRDPMLFTDINRSRKRNPATHLRDATMWWDFTSLRPETTLHTLHLFSDEGSPDGIRRMDGAGVHTFKMVNATNNPVYVKFHWLSNQEWRYLTPEQSTVLAGTNPDYSIQDLYDAIGREEYPSWNMSIQVMTFEQAANHPQNPFDITKHWRREEYPLIPVGRMTLNRNPTDYFTDVESVAFSPANMVPGIEPSPDRMLHARMFSYQDAQRYRLGVNFAQLPVNKAKSRVENYFRDGAMCYGNNGAGEPNYYPNSYGGLDQDTTARQTAFPVVGDVDRVDSGDDDNFSLAKLYLEKDLTPEQVGRLVNNLAGALSNADTLVQQKFLENVAYQISTSFGDSLRDALAAAKSNKH